MNLARVLIVWCAIVPMAIANGLLRDKVLVHFLNPVPARQWSGVMLSIVVFAWTFVTFTWVGRPSPSVSVAIGGLWVLLTVIFEFSFGRLVAKKSWAELIRPYRFHGGDLWVFVLAAVALSPLVVSILHCPF